MPCEVPSEQCPAVNTDLCLRTAGRLEKKTHLAQFRHATKAPEEAHSQQLLANPDLIQPAKTY